MSPARRLGSPRRSGIGLFIILTACLSLLAWVGSAVAPVVEEMWQSLPGGEQTAPGSTRGELSTCRWLGDWWWLCVLGTAASLIGVPAMLWRSKRGRRLLLPAERWLKANSVVVLAAYVAIMGTVTCSISLALLLPLLRIIETLAGGG